MQASFLPRARALYDFSGESDTQLIFKAGDVITIYSQDDASAPGWWYGEVITKDGTTLRGYFPASYVQTIEASETLNLTFSSDYRARASMSEHSDDGGRGASNIDIGSLERHLSPASSKRPLIKNQEFKQPLLQDSFTSSSSRPTTELSALHRKAPSSASTLSFQTTANRSYAQLRTQHEEDDDRSDRDDDDDNMGTKLLRDDDSVSLRHRRESSLDPSLSFRESISKTRVGIFASNMAIFASLVLILMGICVIVWGVFKRDEGLKEEVCGFYSMGISVGILIYETVYGAYRNPTRFPLRALIYTLFSVFTFFTPPTAIGGVCLLCSAITNMVSAYLGETYTPAQTMVADLVDGSQAKRSAFAIFPAFFATVRKKFCRCPSFFKKDELLARRVSRIIFVAAVVTANGILFYMAWKEGTDKRLNYPEDKVQSAWEPYARSFGMLLAFNCGLALLLPTYTTLFRWLHNWSMKKNTPRHSIISRFFAHAVMLLPLNKLTFHRSIAYLTLLLSVGHVFCHMVNWISNVDAAKNRFGLWPYYSGAGLVLLLLFIYGGAMKNVKSKHFALFWFSHLFYLPFYVLLFAHGTNGWNDTIWKWMAVPISIFVIELLSRYYANRHSVVLLSTTHIRPNVVAIEIDKKNIFPQSRQHRSASQVHSPDHSGSLCVPEIKEIGYGYSEGQYVMLCCPSLSPYQWFPFTITSAPQEETITIHVHAKDQGTWSEELQEFMANLPASSAASAYYTYDRVLDDGSQVPGKITGPNRKPILRINGPHACPTQHIGEYDHVMVMGEGSGVCALASTLKSVVLHRWQSYMGGRSGLPDRAIFFWVCAWQDIDTYRWFITQIKDVLDEVQDLRIKHPQAMARRWFELHIYVTKIPDDAGTKDIFAEDNISFWGRSCVHANNERASVAHTKEDIYRAMKAAEGERKMDDLTVHMGRPKWEPHFDAVAERYDRDGESGGQIGVCYAGRNAVNVNELSRMCGRYHTASKNCVFVLHTENI